MSPICQISWENFGNLVTVLRFMLKFESSRKIFSEVIFDKILRYLP